MLHTLHIRNLALIERADLFGRERAPAHRFAHQALGAALFTIAGFVMPGPGGGPILEAIALRDRVVLEIEQLAAGEAGELVFGLVHAQIRREQDAALAEAHQRAQHAKPNPAPRRALGAHSGPERHRLAHVHMPRGRLAEAAERQRLRVDGAGADLRRELLLKAVGDHV